MAWQVRYEPPFIEVTFSDMLSAEDLKEAFGETVRVALEHSTTLILADCRHLSGGHSVVDLYYLISDLDARNDRVSFKEAVLVPEIPASVEKVDFWETACQNRGIRVKVFQDRQSAIEWLTA